MEAMHKPKTVAGTEGWCTQHKEDLRTHHPRTGGGGEGTPNEITVSSLLPICVIIMRSVVRQDRRPASFPPPFFCSKALSDDDDCAQFLDEVITATGVAQKCTI